MPIIPNLAVQNVRNTPGVITDLFENRPAASTNVVAIGTIFVATDTQQIYTFDGTSWVLIGSGSGGGGGINPTSTYMPYNNSGVFQDSFFNENNDKLQSNFDLGGGRVGIGLLIDFSDQGGGIAFETKIGDWNNELGLTGLFLGVNPRDVGNGARRIYASNGGNENGLKLDFDNWLFQLGDFSFDNFGIYLNIQTTIINSFYQANEIGIALNFQSNLYSFGDFNQIYNGTALKINDTSGIINTYYNNYNTGFQLDFFNKIYQLGDFDSYNNGVFLYINDDTQKIITYSVGGQNGLYFDFVNKSYLIGDFLTSFAGTHLNIDDNNAYITWFSNQPARFNDFGSGNMLSATAGGNSGQHLIIYVNGTQYKIELKSP